MRCWPEGAITRNGSKHRLKYQTMIFFQLVTFYFAFLDFILTFRMTFLTPPSVTFPPLYDFFETFLTFLDLIFTFLTFFYFLDFCWTFMNYPRMNYFFSTFLTFYALMTILT